MGIKIGDNNEIKNSNFIGDNSEMENMEFSNELKKDNSLLEKVWNWIKSLFIKTT